PAGGASAPAPPAPLHRYPERPLRQLRLTLPHRLRVRPALGLRPPHGDLGDDRARRLHAAARRARHPAARLHVSHPELGHHRERDGFTLTEGRLPDGGIRVAGVRGRTAAWRALRSQLTTPAGGTTRHLSERPPRRE